MAPKYVSKYSSDALLPHSIWSSKANTTWRVSEVPCAGCDIGMFQTLVLHHAQCWPPSHTQAQDGALSPVIVIHTLFVSSCMLNGKQTQSGCVC